MFNMACNRNTQCIIPNDFWNRFKMWGVEDIELWEQQDAFDFFNSLTEQLDDHFEVSTKVHNYHFIPVCCK